MLEMREFKLRPDELNELNNSLNLPMVYILFNSKDIYVGESYRLPKRME